MHQILEYSGPFLLLLLVFVLLVLQPHLQVLASLLFPSALLDQQSVLLPPPLYLPVNRL
jgi:hypothetical protein